MGKDVIVACDFDRASELFDFLDLFQEKKPFIKIGMELYNEEGSFIVRELKRRGHKIFLDLKIHDIPNTVRKTMMVLSRMEIDICDVHASGGIRMMEAALEGITRLDGKRPLLIGVTQLTSTDQDMLEEELLIRMPMDKVVMHYANNVKRAGLDGIVCSPREAADIKKKLGKRFITVTPGIRFADSEIGDQRRIMTPEQAKETGSDYIVVGRPITQAKDPIAAYNRCCEEFIDKPKKKKTKSPK